MSLRIAEAAQLRLPTASMLSETDSTNLYDEIAKLDAAARLQLAEDLLDNVVSETFATPLPAEHRAELQARLAHHHAHPDEPTLTLGEIRAKAIAGL